MVFLIILKLKVPVRHPSSKVKQTNGKERLWFWEEVSSGD